MDYFGYISQRVPTQSSLRQFLPVFRSSNYDNSQRIISTTSPPCSAKGPPITNAIAKSATTKKARHPDAVRSALKTARHPERSLARSLRQTQSKDPDEFRPADTITSFARESSPPAAIARASFLCALLLCLVLQPLAAQQPVAQQPPPAPQNEITIAPPSSDLVARHIVRVEDEPSLTPAQKLDLIRKKIKYVFVLFQENRSFDFYFGSYPGANNLYSQPPAETPGFIQPFVDTTGKLTTITPFKIPASIVDKNGKTVPLYPADVASVNHNHVPMDNKLHFDSHMVAHNDRYSLVEEGVTLDPDGKPGSVPSLEREQFGELVMAHVDCDTAPFLWNYADRFTLFDNFFDTVIGPSTPNAIAMIAGQSGETQWVNHPELSKKSDTRGGVMPLIADPAPYWGSALDTLTPDAKKQPHDQRYGISKKPAPNFTFATLPLSFMGKDIRATTSADLDPAFDLIDIQNDITRIAGDNNKPVKWAWFQEGYDHEPSDPTAAASNKSYVAHHNAPQYFGYEANNPAETKAHLKGLGDFFTTIKSHSLPSSGVFYVRGGYGNIDKMLPLDPDINTRKDYTGNDDHPAYSDTQISEALIADEINAIAASPYWAQSAIIITYDETDGLYDHTQPRVRDFDAAGNPLDQGPRIPAIVISPFGVVHAVSHQRSEHSSIIKFIDELFNLTPLALLPDEAAARLKGKTEFNQSDLGPADAIVPDVGDLTSAFSSARLTGKKPPLPSSYATLPAAEIRALPHFKGEGCHFLHITPADANLPNPVPGDFNPRPDINPGIPASGNWPY